MSEIAQNEFNDKTNIKVVGVGGAGGNAVNRMIAEGLQNVEFVAVNTDAKDLLRSDADVKISLSDKSSRGLGAGADPERGAKAAQDHQSDIEEALRGADMVLSPSRLLLVRSASKALSVPLPPNTASTTCARKSTR